jgi:hypothetical protein
MTSSSWRIILNEFRLGSPSDLGSASKKTLAMIVDFPRAAAVIRKRFRIRTILRFRRYGILYRVGRTSVFIHGMFYLPRGPRFWRSRLK